jgi:hypothetical protein
MLNQDHATREFEFSLQTLVATLGGPALAQALGIKQGYLNRMANPHDSGAFFRARDLLPVLRLALASLEPQTALAPLMVLARDLGLGLYPVMPAPRPADVIGCLSLTARHFGSLGENSIAALDPQGDSGRRVSLGELRVVEESGHSLISQAAAVVSAIRAIHQGGGIHA